MTKVRSARGSVSEQAARGAGWIIAWRVATRNLGLLSTLVLVRLLQPSDFGLVALASGFLNSVDALSGIGVQDALVRTEQPDRAMYDAGFALSVLRGGATALLIALIAWPLGTFFADRRLTVVILALSVGMLLSAFENIGVVEFRRDLMFEKEFRLNVWPRVAGVVCTVAVAAVWHSYWALVCGILLGRVVRVPLTYWMSDYRPKFALGAWRQIIGFSLWTWALTLLYQARERSESIVIGRLLGAAQVGVFSVGSEIGSLPTTELVEPLGRALFSGFALLHNASSGLGNMFRGAVGLGFLLILPAGLGISMVADPLVRLTLGAEWLAAVPVVQILAVAGTTAIFTSSCAQLLNAIGRPHVTFYIGMASTLAKLAGLLVLVPDYGLRGAAVALAVSAIVDLLLFLRITLPRIGVSFFQVTACAVRPLLAALAMVALLGWLHMAWTPTQATDLADLCTDLAVRSGAGAICYGTVLLGSWLLAGRPDGAEQFVLAMIWKLSARIRPESWFAPR